MNAPDNVPAVAPSEERLRSLEKGVRLFGVTILLLSALPNIGIAYGLEGFAATFTLINSRPAQGTIIAWAFAQPGYLLFLAILWPISGTFIALLARTLFGAMLSTCIYLFLITAQFSFTAYIFASALRQSLPLIAAP